MDVRAMQELGDSESTMGESMGEWISVDDRMPEKDGKYLVWRVKYNGKHGYDCVDFLGDDFWSARVLYWMPLPEPPESED